MHDSMEIAWDNHKWLEITLKMTRKDTSLVKIIYAHKIKPS